MRREHIVRQGIRVVGGLAGAMVGVTACGPAPGYWEDTEPYANVRQETRVEQPVEQPVEEVAASSRASALGRWIGMGKQSDGVKWKVDLDVTHLQKGPCAIVRYPDAGCAGYWTCESISRSGRIRATERITHGQDRCVDGVSIDAVISGDGRRLGFDADAGEITAAARLRRADGR